MAQHGCLPCSRYFATAVALETHVTGKPHKRRLKKLQDEPYTIEESRRAVGLGVRLMLIRFWLSSVSEPDCLSIVSQVDNGKDREKVPAASASTMQVEQAEPNTA